jgi:tetratricopeptide (TPR) repeat protein
MSRLITKTLAEIYFKQGDYQKAYEIYKALFEKNPTDEDIQKRLKELRETLNLAAPTTHSPTHPIDPSTQENIQVLEKWLTNIQERRKGK